MVLVCTLHLCETNVHPLHRLVNGHKLVLPSDLCDYHDHHQFLGPSCLCPLFGLLEETLVFKEAAIYMPVFGPYAGKHIAECQESRCRYLGQSLGLLQIAIGTDAALLSSLPRANVYEAKGPSKSFLYERLVPQFPCQWDQHPNILMAYADAFTACPSPVHYQWELQSRRTLKRTYAVSSKWKTSLSCMI